MKILLTNWELRKVGGSQLWTYTIYKALRLLGHDVRVFTPKPGAFAQVFHNVENSIPTGLDLIISNQSIGNGSTIPTIANSHSTFVPIEKFRPGANKYVAISQEVKSANHNKEFDSQIILNPVDNSVYCRQSIPNKKVKTILYMNHDGSGAYKTIKEVCDELNIELLTLNGKHNFSDLINKADLCIGIGRCLIEAMSCGRPVISGDKRSWMNAFSGYGSIDAHNFDEAQLDNYSGRTKPKLITKSYLRNQIHNYDSGVGSELKTLALREHNYIKIAEEYLKLYEQM